MSLDCGWGKQPHAPCGKQPHATWGKQPHAPWGKQPHAPWGKQPHDPWKICSLQLRLFLCKSNFVDIIRLPQR